MAGILNNLFRNILPFNLPGTDPKSEAEKAAEKALKEQDKAAARNTERTSKSAISKMNTDGFNQIMNGYADSAMKATNAVSKTAQGIQF